MSEVDVMHESYMARHGLHPPASVRPGLLGLLWSGLVWRLFGSNLARSQGDPYSSSIKPYLPMVTDYLPILV
jgi:hypothetical protein